MSIKKGKVCILKAQSDDDSGTYVQIMRESDLVPEVIPVLSFEYCNLSHLKDLLNKPQDYSGIIFTSPRAVHAVSGSIGSAENFPSEWQDRSFFTVGEATKRILFNELNADGKCGDTENAVGLADLILKGTYDRPLLFPCSDMRRETLPSLLSQRGILLEEISVYHTKAHPQLEENLNFATAQGTEFPEYIIFFSPSGIKYALPILNKLNAPFDSIKVVAIGGTTQAALKEANVSVWSCSTKPNPNDLLKAILGDSN